MDPNRDVACCEELWQSWSDTGDIALYESGWVLTPGRDIPIRFCPFCGNRLSFSWDKAYRALVARYDKAIREHQDKVDVLMKSDIRSQVAQGSSRSAE